MRGLFVVGTDTEVGKTIFGSLLASCLRGRGIRVGVFKPVESGVEDAKRLKEASGDPAPLDHIVVYSLKYPVAPYVSALEEGVKIEKEKIFRVFRERVAMYQFFICEGAGGLFVPIWKDLMVSDLVKGFGLPVVVVARSNLGAINHTVLTVKALKGMGVEVKGVVINHLKKNLGLAERSLKKVLSELLDVDIVGEIPYLEDGLGEVGVFEKSVDIEKLVGA